VNDISREQFASAVTAAVSSVHHLYREVNRLIFGLRDLLGEPPESLVPVSGTLARSGRDQTRLVVRNEYGVLFTRLVSDDEDSDEADEDDEDLEEDSDEEDTRARKRTPAEIAADQFLLGVRIALYDPQKKESFEPHVAFGVMEEWAVGGQAFAPDQRFLLARYMLRRIPKVLAGAETLSKGARLQTAAAVKSAGGAKRAAGRRLSCRLPIGVETVPLYSLNSADELDRLAQRMKDMWTSAVTAAAGR
jgi:hypothetical protein